MGLRFPKGAGKLAWRVRTALEARPELKAAFEPLLSCVEALKREIARLDAAVVARAKAAPACRLLMSVPGIGPVTALAFAATIDDPSRFAKSRTVGAYLGLTTRRFQSGEMDLRASATQAFLWPLRLLIQAAPSPSRDGPCAPP